MKDTIERTRQRIRSIEDLEELHRQAAGTFRNLTGHGLLKEWPEEED
jgi:hypothetical protein